MWPTTHNRMSPPTRHPATRHPATRHPATRHPATRHPATRHPATRHPVTRHPATRHPATRHPATRHPTAPSRPASTACRTVSFPGVCIDFAWTCPPEMPIRFDECGPSCPGLPEPCCDSVGGDTGQQECVLGSWSCAGGSAPNWCCGASPTVCVSECSGIPAPMNCARGELFCAEGSFDRTECGWRYDAPL
jgi:hypothetical protein